MKAIVNVGDIINLSLKSIYDELGGQLEHGEILKEIDGEFEYHDLQTSESGTVCMDGEECKIVDIGDFGYELLNMDDNSEHTFILTEIEFDVGYYGY